MKPENDWCPPAWLHQLKDRIERGDTAESGNIMACQWPPEPKPVFKKGWERTKRNRITRLWGVMNGDQAEEFNTTSELLAIPWVANHPTDPKFRGFFIDGATLLAVGEYRHEIGRIDFPVLVDLPAYRPEDAQTSFGVGNAKPKDKGKIYLKSVCIQDDGSKIFKVFDRLPRGVTLQAWRYVEDVLEGGAKIKRIEIVLHDPDDYLISKDRGLE